MKGEYVKYLKTGEDIERRGIRFYTKALRQAGDFNSRGLLKFLMVEEKNHLAYLKAMEKGREGRAKKIKNPVFSRKAYSKMGGRRATTLSVFNTALEMELESIRLYAGLARKVRDKDLKRLLKRLVNFEKNHFRLIKMHQGAIYDYLYWEVRTQGRVEM